MGQTNVAESEKVPSILHNCPRFSIWSDALRPQLPDQTPSPVDTEGLTQTEATAPQLLLGRGWLTFGSLCSEKPKISTSGPVLNLPEDLKQWFPFRRQEKVHLTGLTPDQRKVSSPVSALGHSQGATNHTSNAKKAEEPPSRAQAGRYIMGSAERGVSQGLQGPGELRTHLNLPLSLFPFSFPFLPTSPFSRHF